MQIQWRKERNRDQKEKGELDSAAQTFPTPYLIFTGKDRIIFLPPFLQMKKSSLEGLDNLPKVLGVGGSVAEFQSKCIPPSTGSHASWRG